MNAQAYDETGEVLNSHTSTGKYTAAICGATECVRILASLPGVDVNQAPSKGHYRGETPLTVADNSEIASILKANGAIEIVNPRTASCQQPRFTVKQSPSPSSPKSRSGTPTSGNTPPGSPRRSTSQHLGPRLGH